MMETKNKRISREELVVKCMRNQSIPYRRIAKLTEILDVFPYLRFNAILGDFLFYESDCINTMFKLSEKYLKIAIPSNFLIGSDNL